MIIEFDIRGVDEMERLLFQLGDAVSRRLGDLALRAGAKPVIEEAQRTVAVGTSEPHLRDSMRAVVQRQDARAPERVLFIGFDKRVSFRAHFLEFGTAHSAAKPFLRPALDTKAEEALNAMGRSLARGITREAKKLAKPLK